MPRARRSGGALLAAALALAVFGACSTTGSTDPAPPAAARQHGGPAHSPGHNRRPHHAYSQHGNDAPGRQVEKLMTFVVENKTFDQMRTEMPWVTRLADRYGYATGYSAHTHPSLPNYLAIAGGGLFGVTDDDAPSAHPLRGPSIFGQALAAGSTAGLYAEAMTANCELVPDGRYAVKHNPWAYFVDERDACGRHDVPLEHLSGDIRTGNLPVVGMVVPDLCDDAHDCPLSQADAWLHRVVGEIMSGPDWKSGEFAIVITADEDDRTADNHVLTVVAHPGLDHDVVATPMNHYALGRAYADVGGFAPLGNSADAPSLLTLFGLRA